MSLDLDLYNFKIAAKIRSYSGAMFCLLARPQVLCAREVLARFPLGVLSIQHLQLANPRLGATYPLYRCS